MKKRSFVISVFCLSLLTGCQQSGDGLELEEEYPVFIEASIGGVASRYTGSKPNDAAFANGDKIGLAYKVGTDAPTSFVEWTFNNNDWTANSPMKWKNLGEEHTFYAFYPYGENGASTTVDQIKMPILTNQNGEMLSVAACDFLVATKTMKYSNEGEVSFTDQDAFKHVSSLVVLKLKNVGDLVSATINNISLAGTDLVAGSNYSFVDIVDTEEDESEKVTLEDGGTNDDTMNANLTGGVEMNEDKVFYFVVNSGTVDLSAVTLSITYTLGSGEVYKAVKQGLNKDGGHVQFLKGYYYNYSITVTTDKNLLISGYEIDKWDEGSSMDITIESEKQEETNEN